MSVKNLVDRSLEHIGAEGYSGMVVSGTSTKSAVLRILNSLFKTESESHIDKVHRNLVRQKLITVQQNSKREYLVTITPSGAYRISSNALNYIELTRANTWDGLWRLVSYDLPSARKSERYQLTKHLKRLGLVCLHGSVWITPNECESSITLLTQSLGISRYITIAEVTRLDSNTERRLRGHFSETLTPSM